MKTFTTTIGELYDLEQAILKSGAMNMSFSKKASFSIARNLKKMSAELEEYKTQRSELIKEYSGGNDTIGPESERWSEFVPQFTSLNGVEVAIEINTITTEDFPETATPFVCALLEFMIEEPIETVEQEG